MLTIVVFSASGGSISPERGVVSGEDMGVSSRNNGYWSGVSVESAEAPNVAVGDPHVGRPPAFPRVLPSPFPSVFVCASFARPPPPAFRDPPSTDALRALCGCVSGVRAGGRLVVNAATPSVASAGCPWAGDEGTPTDALPPVRPCLPAAVRPAFIVRPVCLPVRSKHRLRASVNGLSVSKG